MVNGLRGVTTGQSVTRQLADINVRARTIRHVEGLGDQLNGATEHGTKTLATKAATAHGRYQSASDALSEDVDNTTLAEHELSSAAGRGARRVAGGVRDRKSVV